MVKRKWKLHVIVGHILGKWVVPKIWVRLGSIGCYGGYIGIMDKKMETTY